MTKLHNKIREAVTEAVSSPHVDASMSAVEPITSAVVKEAEEQVNRVTGNVAWYKSPVIWGLIGMELTRQIAHWGYEIPPEYHGDVLTFVVTYGPTLAGVVILWGQKSIIKRWFSKKEA